MKLIIYSLQCIPESLVNCCPKKKREREREHPAIYTATQPPKFWALKRAKPENRRDLSSECEV